MSSNFSEQSNDPGKSEQQNLALIRKLSDSNLLAETKNLAQKERELLTVVLHHLREVKKRRLYSTLRYRSMLEYAVKELMYSEDQAYRRLAAMDLLTEVPELEEKINQGSLSLSNISVAAKTFRAESKASGQIVDTGRKVEILKAVENKSRREAESIVQQITTAPAELLKPEFTRVVQGQYLEIRLNLPKEMEQKIEQIKAHLSHAHPHLSTSELFKKLVDEYIAKIEKQRQQKRAIAQSRQSSAVSETVARPKSTNAESAENTGAQEPQSSEQNSAPIQKHCTNVITNSSLNGGSRNTRVSATGRRAYISVKVRREVFARAEHRCENCRSERFLEVDHCEPLAFGGTNDISNFRVLCRSCNQRRAVESFGQVKMDEFFELSTCSN